MRKLALLLLLAASGQGVCAAEELLLTRAAIVDIGAGRILPDQAVLIRDGVIASISAQRPAGMSDQALVVDLGGRYVMPGLWDMHVHPFRESDLELMVANGVTGARIMAGEPRHLAWRARIALGDLAGPRLFIAGPIVEGPPPAALAAVVDTEDRRLIRTAAQAVVEVRAQKAAGFDYIKVYNNLAAEAYDALVLEARRQGMRVVGHVPFEVGLDGALAAGQSSIEHLRGYVQKLVPAGAPIQPGVDLRSRTLAWEYADLAGLAPLVEASRAAGTWQCPTLSIRIHTATAQEIEQYLRLPHAAYLDPASRNALEHREQTKWLSNFSAEDWQRAARGHAHQDALVTAMHRAGVPILAGTDVTPFGFALHGELERLVGAGLSAREALRAATSNPARFVGLADRLGSVADGYEADLVILERNPLEEIRNTRAIYAVVARGRLMDRATLDATLARVKERRQKPAAPPATAR